MQKPMLVVLAAGMGSRFGGNKQIAPVDDMGHTIMDFSIYDAMRAGFGKVVIIVKRDFAGAFRAQIGDRIAGKFPVEYAYQSLEMLPEGFEVPAGREKPWGTAHAALCAKDAIDAPFCVINADDFYGAGAFRAAHAFMSGARSADEHAMVGYHIENTLTENGSVARGVCAVEDGMLRGIRERTYILPAPGGAQYSEDGGQTFTFVPNGTIVSMNLWCFGETMLGEIETRFSTFLQENLPINPLTCEYFLPLVPNLMIRENAARFRVLETGEKWYGMTYRADLAHVQRAVSEMKRAGEYPAQLWG